MSVKVYIAELGVKKLTKLIAKLRAQAPFAILERPDKVDFLGPSEMIEVPNWPKGRVFGERLELYWEQEGMAYRVRLTCADEAPSPPEFDEVLTLEEPEPEPVWYYLWGEDEIAIGGRLSYSRAIPGKGRGQLGVVEYRDGEGRLVFYRYVRLRREG